MSSLGFRLRRPFHFLAVLTSVCGATAVATACTVTSTNTGTGTGTGTDGGSGGGGADSAPYADGAPPATGSLGFTPSNVDLSGIDLTKVGDFVVDDGACSIDTDSNLASCGDGANVLGFKLAMQSDGTTVAVYVARSMTINAGKNLTVAGSHPLVFIALDKISIAGSLNGNSHEEVGVAGGFTQMTARTKGGGPGGGAAGTDLSASGGGSYCGVGGAGGAEGTPSAGGATYGAPAISPHVAGSSGGDVGGAGGGAISSSPEHRSRSRLAASFRSAPAAAASAASRPRTPRAAAAVDPSCSSRSR